MKAKLLGCVKMEGWGFPVLLGLSCKCHLTLNGSRNDITLTFSSDFPRFFFFSSQFLNNCAEGPVDGIVSKADSALVESITLLGKGH